MAELVIKLPDSVAALFGTTPEARARRIAEDAAVEEYRTGRLSHRQVGDMLGLDYWQTERFLSERKISINYEISDMEADINTLRELPPKQ